MTAPSRVEPFLQRGLRRHQAAAYLGVGVTKFDQWVTAGIMPRAIRKDGIVVWDRLELDMAFDALKEEDTVENPFNSVAV